MKNSNRDKGKRKKNYHRFIYIFLFVLLAGLFVGCMAYTQMFPMLYIIVAGIVCFLLFLFVRFLLYGKRTSRLTIVLGKIFTVLLCLLLAIGNLYLYRTYNSFASISLSNGSLIEVSVRVLADDEAEELDDLNGSLFGLSSAGDTTYTNESVSEIETVFGESIETSSYLSFVSMAEGLYGGEVDAIIINEAYLTLIEDEYEDFESETKVIASFTFVDESSLESIAVDVTSECFVVYLSGIDTDGDITSTGNSDVNKLIVVNPTTKEILMINIPRDYYIAQTCQDYLEDKLTHTGVYGIECTVDSVSEYFGIEVNYYLRVNFSSVVEIVDALGGVTIENDYAFSSFGFYFPVGTLELDGEETLAFCRERKTLEDGDNSRIANQAKVVEALLEKCMSSTIITNYLSILEAVEDCIQTNMNEVEISSLVKMQLSDMASWNITSYSVTGEDAYEYSPLNGFDSYVMIPDESSVEIAIALYEQVVNGETPTVPES